MEITGKLYIVERLKSSVNGNPRFSCLVVDGHGDGTQFVTGVDSSHGYTVTNYRQKRVTVPLKELRGKLTLQAIALSE